MFHESVFTGQAGTGKTTLLKRLSAEAKSSRRNVVIVTSTGIASLQYPHAQTLHSWCGLGDGRFSSHSIVNQILTDQSHQKILTNIKTTDLLLIDEISMISSHVFEKVDYILRNIRSCEKLFGDIQIVLGGDFYQLPPVPDFLYGDCGSFCFHSPLIQRFHVFTLTEVHRQSDKLLIEITRQLSTGHIKPEIDNKCQSLNQTTIPQQFKDAIHLVATNLQCDYINAAKLHEMPGDLTNYVANDTGPNTHHQKILAPKVLYIKLGCPVILLRNISSTVVNGMRGSVIGLQHHQIEVKLLDGRVICKY